MTAVMKDTSCTYSNNQNECRLVYNNNQNELYMVIVIVGFLIIRLIPALATFFWLHYPIVDLLCVPPYKLMVY
jgi:hypothetical protein